MHSVETTSKVATTSQTPRGLTQNRVCEKKLGRVPGLLVTHTTLPDGREILRGEGESHASSQAQTVARTTAARHSVGFGPTDRAP